MNRTLKQLGAVALAVGMTTFAAASADAAIFRDDSADFTVGVETNPGVHGLEVRGAYNTRSWELGVGTQTSNTGTFSQADFVWHNTFNYFEYEYGSDAATLKIWNTLDKSGTLTEVSYSGDFYTGNAVQILAKRKAELTITKFDGVDVDYSIGDLTADDWITATFISDSFADGFKIAGIMNVAAGGGSANEIMIKAGDVPPVPLPAAAWFMLTAFGGLVGSRWLKGRTADQAA